VRLLSLFLLSSLVLTSCAPVIDTPVIDEKMVSYNIDFDGRSYYFYYPESANVVEGDSGWGMKYGSCLVNLSKNKIQYDDAVFDGNVETVTSDDVVFKAVYNENILRFYSAEIALPGFYIWTSGSSSVSSCVDIVNVVARSFSTDPDYSNDKWRFSAFLPIDYKFEELPSGEGVLLKKWVEVSADDVREGEPDQMGGYKIEMSLWGEQNLRGWSNVGELVAEKYPGYVVDFNDGGVYVDDGSGEEAFKRFFYMSRDGKIIYEAYLKVSSIRFPDHEQEFIDFIKGVVF